MKKISSKDLSKKEEKELRKERKKKWDILSKKWSDDFK